MENKVLRTEYDKSLTTLQELNRKLQSNGLVSSPECIELRDKIHKLRRQTNDLDLTWDEFIKMKPNQREECLVKLLQIPHMELSYIQDYIISLWGHPVLSKMKKMGIPTSFDKEVLYEAENEVKNDFEDEGDVEFSKEVISSDVMTTKIEYELPSMDTLETLTKIDLIQILNNVLPKNWTNTVYHQSVEESISQFSKQIGSKDLNVMKFMIIFERIKL